jgi:benzoylformate decarboxylase
MFRSAELQGHNPVESILSIAKNSLRARFPEDVVNCQLYRILKERTHALGGFLAKADSYIGMDLEQPAIDFVGLAKALGVPGERVDKVKNVRHALTRAWQRGGPFLIDVLMDRSFKPEDSAG